MGSSGSKSVFPLPSGQFSVGCCDIMTSEEGNAACGGLFIRLYYPTLKCDIQVRRNIKNGQKIYKERKILFDFIA